MFCSIPLASFLVLIFLHHCNSKHVAMCCCPSPVRLIQIYCTKACEVSQDSCCRHKNFLLLVVGPCLSACKLLVCPSKLMRSNLPLSSPLRHPFSVSAVLVQSRGMSFLLGHTVPHKFIWRLSKSSPTTVCLIHTPLYEWPLTHKLNATEISTSSTVTAKQI